MLIVNTGPGDRIIAESGQVAPIGVPVEVADDLALRLLEQDVWRKSAPKKETK